MGKSDCELLEEALGGSSWDDDASIVFRQPDSKRGHKLRYEIELEGESKKMYLEYGQTLVFDSDGNLVSYNAPREGYLAYEINSAKEIQRIRDIIKDDGVGALIELRNTFNTYGFYA